MALYPFVEEAQASAEVRAVYEDIKATRKVDWINNFWKVLANHPASLKQTWTSLKQIMGPGAIDARTKEMLYLAVSMSNGCDYCTVSHTAAARKQGMTDAMLHELIAIVGMANETNRVVQAYRVEPDEKLIEAAKGPKG
ncbi:MAG TPA: carboxymuconolactone decarboxylase family protein [Dongiaceae bacterium]|nr:carboxymuconolactone decarboxylase family protein [Dongiaceae bacterium]